MSEKFGQAIIFNNKKNIDAINAKNILFQLSPGDIVVDNDGVEWSINNIGDNVRLLSSEGEKIVSRGERFDYFSIKRNKPKKIDSDNMSTNELSSSEGKIFEINTYSYEKIKRQLNSIKKDMEDLESMANSKKISSEDYIRESQVKVESFLKELMRNKDRFKNVYKTEHGSLYFTLNSGESFRIKRNIISKSPEYEWHVKDGDNRKIWEPQVIMSKVFFIQSEDADRLQAHFNEKVGGKRRSSIMGEEFRPETIREGLCPFEIALPEEKQNFQIKETEGTIKILPLGSENENAFFPIHFGDRISEIIR